MYWLLGWGRYFEPLDVSLVRKNRE
uniref:Uncharacterized protein n=1 Tax=Anguilla anguilla TaxID=7936 RepID=A0A0E9UN53_ANGAN